MGTTIIEILKNAEYNLQRFNGSPQIPRDQLHNALILLDKGYGLYDHVDVNELNEKYGSLEDVPEKGEL